MKLKTILEDVKPTTGKTLYAFDMDDTLIKSNSMVIVRNEKTKKSFELSPAQFAVYEPKDDETFDFSDFDSLRDPEEVKHTFDLFAQILKKTTGSRNAKTVIITARTPKIRKDLMDFLKRKNLPAVHLHALGSSDPYEKAKVVQQYIDKGYTTVRFYDDSPKNVAAVRALKTSNKGVDIKATLVRAH